MNRVTHLDCYFKEAPVLLFGAINFYLLSCGGGCFSASPLHLSICGCFVTIYSSLCPLCSEIYAAEALAARNPIFLTVEWPTLYAMSN
jgi:hypothetical protein